MPYTPDPKYFELREKDSGPALYYCLVCRDGHERQSHHVKVHENTDTHRLALTAFVPEEKASDRGTHTPSTNQPTNQSTNCFNQVVIEDAVRALLASGTSQPGQPWYPPDHPFAVGEPGLDHLSPVTGIDWGLYSLGDTSAELSPQEQLRNDICEATLDWLNGNISDEDIGEPSDLESAESSSDSEHHYLKDDQPRKRARTNRQNPLLEDWFPWQDRITCTLDILMHLPRSVFSRKQLDLFLWLLRVNNVDDVPSTKSMQLLNKILQDMCGIETRSYDGKLGHNYHANVIDQILAQEMCNPKVRPHLHFYPEDAGSKLSEARQAARWLHELQPEETTPMIRIPSGDFYIYEPTMLRDATACIPFRWFTRHGRFYAKAWRLATCIIEGTAGWVVHKENEFEVSQDDLMKNFPLFSKDCAMYNLPHPSRIFGVHPTNSADSGVLQPWTHTNPVLGNRWRNLANGHCVMSLPLWMYCDDTSGNTSKKWNEHNSFLFTLAGLPREQTAKEYNIHFVCTSNTAQLLEMLDGVVNQIETAQTNGIWAWDSEVKEPVLIFPTILALLGDNPMHSEFACHIGLRGKFFCRACWVKGTNAEASQGVVPSVRTPSSTPAASPASSPASSRAASPVPTLSSTSQLSSTALPFQVSAPVPSPVAASSAVVSGGLEEPSSATPAPKLRKKKPESMAAMLSRITAFIRPNRPRNRSETKRTLQTYYDKAQVIGAKTKLKTARTETGIKDTFQEFFFEKLFASYKSKNGPQAKQEALDQAVKKLPSDITSPVWRLEGLDPHQDTPVEILHVVLLGFVKYFWRDLIQNRLNEEQKKLLIQRLNSVNISGLGITRLGGETLVNYAGSLTGRDFRAIAQVAPFTIYDLVPADVFEAWLSLSKLIPLVWQPQIDNIYEFLGTLEYEIRAFLLRTARWTTAWFNKSKFHIILHLPSHIRRFGPAILFATEAFESFNAVIRAKSVHSNRQAPSRDIALAFAQGNRIRHLLSGGYVMTDPAPAVHFDGGPESTSAATHAEKMAQGRWRTIGPGPMQLVTAEGVLPSYLGLPQPNTIVPGTCKRDKTQPRSFIRTQTAVKLPSVINTESKAASGWQTCSEVQLFNGDKCSLGDHVIVQRHNEYGFAMGRPFLAHICEVLQMVGSSNHDIERPDGILVQSLSTSDIAPKFQMPRLIPLNEWSFVPLSVSCHLSCEKKVLTSTSQDLLCTVNTQHDCDRNSCTASGFRYIYQEQVQTEQQRAVVEHVNHPQDLILNTAQMRDAVHLQKFRVRSAALNEDAIIQETVSRTIDQRRSGQGTPAADKQVHPSATNPRGRGGSRGASSNRSRGRGRGGGAPGGGAPGASGLMWVVETGQ